MGACEVFGNNCSVLDTTNVLERMPSGVARAAMKSPRYVPAPAEAGLISCMRWPNSIPRPSCN